jgi:hypothetical protein
MQAVIAHGEASSHCPQHDAGNPAACEVVPVASKSQPKYLQRLPTREFSDRGRLVNCAAASVGSYRREPSIARSHQQTVALAAGQRQRSGPHRPGPGDHIPRGGFVLNDRTHPFMTRHQNRIDLDIWGPKAEPA